MAQTHAPSTKREAYRLYREGHLSESAARDILGDDWPDAERLEDVEEILTESRAEYDDGELFY